jgi:class 3 adenylate cyclase/tetratricopeptide (TPR) repeat protein
MAGETRKIVTVLFMDVVGSTELSERLDPESTRRVMTRLFETVGPVLEHHGATVEKYIGDAVMAVFGIPAVHEDDALRACRAAIEIQDEMLRLNKELERDWGVTISTRTGLNTGEVITGDPSTGHTLVTGDAVNTAARLEQSAGPGTVLIGERTYRLVAHAVEVEPSEPVAAKGKADVVAAHRLLSIVPGTSIRARRLDSPMVGRSEELGLLGQALDRSIAETRCVLATVVGMPGVGKSRLVHEFAGSVADKATVLRGRCLPYGEGITFWPIVNVVHQAARITESDTPEDAKSRIKTLLPEGDDRAVVLDRVAAAVGLEEATWSINETFWAIRKLFESLASDRPLMLVFDDIHWAEPTFLDLIEYLEGWSGGSATLALCIARPELLDTRPGWASSARQPLTVELDPLASDESDRLIENLLGPNALSDGFRGRIAETAEGNPLFLEEMLGMLMDDERIRREEGRWVASGDEASVPTPSSIQSLLAARIERLPDAERAILQRASVVGKVFWWGAVADLSPIAERAQVSSQLQELVRRGMVRPDRSDIAGHDAFRFRHILIRDAAYASLPRAARADLHERLADWIERTVGGRIEEYEEIVGYHLEHAFHQKLTAPAERDRALAARASRLLASAGRRALDRNDVNAAVNLLSRGSELDPTNGPDDLSIRLPLALALQLAGEWQQASAVVTDLVERARAAGNRGLEWRARIRQGRIIAATTDVPSDKIMGTVHRAIEIFAELGDEWGLSQSWSLLAWMHFNVGQAGEAQKANALAASHARTAGDTAAEMWGLVGLTNNAIYGPMPVEEALVKCHETLDHVKGQPGYEAAIFKSVALLEAMRGNFEAARAAIARTRLVWRELGSTFGLAGMADTAGDIEWYAGDIDAEERERRSGYEAFRKMGAQGYQATSSAWLARPLVDLGRHDEALELTRESEAMAAEDDITAQIPWREARGLILARRGEMEEAEKLAREAVEIAERTDWLNMQGDAQMALADVLRLAERTEDALDAARAALDRYERKGNVVAAGWARTLLEGLARPHG